MRIIYPYTLKIRTQKFTDGEYGTKYYRAGFDQEYRVTKFSRRKHKRASDAIQYGRRVKARWCRLFEAKLDMVFEGQS